MWRLRVIDHKKNVILWILKNLINWVKYLAMYRGYEIDDFSWTPGVTRGFEVSRLSPPMDCKVYNQI